MKKIIIFKTEGESLRMRSFLESKRIPFVIKSFRDAAYSSVFQNQYGWGMLEAPEEFEESILEFYHSEAQLPEEIGEAPSRVVLTTAKNKHTGVYLFVIALLTVLSGTFAWLYYDLKKKNSSDEEASLVYSEWSRDGDVLISRWKKNHQLSIKEVDRNHNNLFELIEYYDTSGVLISSGYDLNGNGFYDKSIFYSGKDTVREEFVDTDEDGLSDEGTFHLSDGHILFFFDQNQDHAYDSIYLRDKENKTIQTYTMKGLTEQLVKK